MKGVLVLSVEKNMMQAIAWIKPDEVNLITKDYILETLNDQGIKAGIRDEVIEEMLESTEYMKKYIIAIGKDPIPGNNGYYEYFFDTTSYGNKPEIKEDGTVDYSIRRALVNIGDLLAEYHPALPGHFGYTVYADIIAPVPTKNLPGLRLIGAQKIGNSYYALVNGEVSLEDYLLQVNERLIISGDAGVSTGSITYTGDVYVTGDVLTDVTIHADGNVIVNGVVEGAHIEAGKDIVIRHGVHGKNKAHLKAKGSVYSLFIKEAHVEAGENISLNNAYLSELIAKNEVIAKGRPGSIIGGSVFAGDSISAKITGNHLGIPTYLFITSMDHPVTPFSKILIEHRIFTGTEIRMGNVKYLGIPDKTGEFHLVDHEVSQYEIGKFYYASTTPIKTAPLPKRKYTVLLVDDEPMILKTFYSYLYNDYQVLAVSSAADAFALMESTIPDLILLDYMMPHMDGIQMLERIRKATWKPYTKVPVIFVTAVKSKNVVTKCLSLYPQGYLTKPLGKTELLSAVAHFFNSHPD